MTDIFLGCDSDGFLLAEKIRAYLRSLGFTIHDFGVNNSNDEKPYYEIATEVAKVISAQPQQKGILICGTGMGMAIIANKFPHVYASVCEQPLVAQYARSINNSNILTLGQLLTTPELAYAIIDVWLTTEFTQGWNEKNKTWLQHSMHAIQQLEKNIMGK